MLRSKILLKITGSIAAYKTGTLISKLIQEGCEVQTVATKSALEFIGPGTLEGLTGNPVLSDVFETGRMMDHIRLTKWADITVLAPASANTLNRMAAGIGDSPVTALFLAHDWAKPYVIAPAMNTKMLNHPATKRSLKTLQRWGAHILPTASGYLACGDDGKGKMIEPDIIFEHIKTQLKYTPIKSLSILITYGGTQESIDGVRYLKNMSTGKTGGAIAKYFIKNGHSVTCLHAVDLLCPDGAENSIPFLSFSDLEKTINKCLKTNSFDAIIHCAAVSDYSPVSLITGKKQFSTPVSKKISSVSSITLELMVNPKLVDIFKSHPISNNAILVAFKFTSNSGKDDTKSLVKKLFNHSQADIVVHNDLAMRVDSEQKHFQIYSQLFSVEIVNTAVELAEKLEENFLVKTEESHVS